VTDGTLAALAGLGGAILIHINNTIRS